MADPGALSGPPASSRPKVLVADDEQDIATLIEDWLSDLYEVTIALNGKAAVQKAIWHRPQLVLLDAVMPDMGAADVLQMLGNTPQTEKIPVVVMVAKNVDAVAVEILKGKPNVFGLLTKPFKPSELVRLIQGILMGGGPSFSPSPSAGAPLPASPPRSVGGMKEVVIPDAPLAPPPRMPAVPPAPRGTTPETVMARRAIDRSGMTEPIPSIERSSSAAGYANPEMESSPLKAFIRRGTKRLGQGALVLAGVLGVLFGSAEWVSRRAEYALGTPFFVPPLYPASRFNSFIPYQWHSPEKSKASFFDDGRVVYEFNQWGLRGPDFPAVAPDGVTRVLLVGGTFLFGPGVEEEQTAAHRLEALLNREKPGAYHVINAGLWALSPEEQWAYVMGQGLTFKPQAIVWLCENRGPEMPSTKGLQWLASHRWLVRGVLGNSRFIRLLIRLKIQAGKETIVKPGDPLFEEAERTARKENIALTYWILPRQATRGSRAETSRYFPGWETPVAAYHATVADRLARVLDKKTP